MKTKLTLSIDPAVSHRAKQIAKSKGTSLSGWVEAHLRRETGMLEAPPHPPTQSFSEKWGGRMRPRDDDHPRTLHLKRKYGLEPDS